MGIKSIGGPGSAAFGTADLKALPLATMTKLVMADIMMTRQSAQQQQVEELAEKNKQMKRYNDAVSEAVRLAEGFDDKAQSDTKRPVENDHKAITWESMNDWNHIAQGDFSAKDCPKGSIMVPDEKGVLVEKKLDGLSFEERLNLLSEKSIPPMNDNAKEFLRGRARLADIAQTYGMLPGGLLSKGTSYVNIAHGDVSKGTLDTLKTKLKTASEAISSENQLGMIKLQEVIGGVDSSKTTLTQYVKGEAEAQKEIARNI
jgi:hypothetical protein